MNYKEKIEKDYSNNFQTINEYYNLIEKYNQVMNLTGFSGERLWKEGIFESIKSLEWISMSGSLLDIGAGAGFPSVPFKIINNEIKLTVLEPQIKRLNFLKDVASNLNLSIEFINERAEDYKKNKTFDFITARAVAPLFKLIEISYHLGHIGSTFLWIKGKNYKEELLKSKKIIKKLDIDIDVKTIVIDNKEINIIVYMKKKASPAGIPRLWKDIK